MADGSQQGSTPSWYRVVKDTHDRHKEGFRHDYLVPLRNNFMCASLLSPLILSRLSLSLSSYICTHLISHSLCNDREGFPSPENKIGLQSFTLWGFFRQMHTQSSNGLYPIIYYYALYIIIYVLYNYIFTWRLCEMQSFAYFLMVNGDKLNHYRYQYAMYSLRGVLSEVCLTLSPLISLPN